MHIGTQARTQTAKGKRGAFTLLAILAAMGQPAMAQDQPKAPDNDAAQRFEDFKASAESYVIERESNPPVTLTLVRKPALRWSNPLRIAYDGAVFVWTAEGRPEAVASIYRNVERGMTMEHHEFQSLSESSLTATSNGNRVWAPQSPGIALKLIPGAPAPADEAPARLRQMRVLAREFQAGYDHEEKARGLSFRMLTTPLYRHEKSRPELVDGVLFAFVQATDPEALLLIEARPNAGVPTWQYSFARLSGRGLRGWHKDQLVWEVPTVPSLENAPYTNVASPVAAR